MISSKKDTEYLKEYIEYVNVLFINKDFKNKNTLLEILNSLTILDNNTLRELGILINELRNQEPNIMEFYRWIRVYK